MNRGESSGAPDQETSWEKVFCPIEKPAREEEKKMPCSQGRPKGFHDFVKSTMMFDPGEKSRRGGRWYKKGCQRLAHEAKGKRSTSSMMGEVAALDGGEGAKGEQGRGGSDVSNVSKTMLYPAIRGEIPRCQPQVAGSSTRERKEEGGAPLI